MALLNPHLIARADGARILFFEQLLYIFVRAFGCDSMSVHAVLFSMKIIAFAFPESESVEYWHVLKSCVFKTENIYAAPPPEKNSADAHAG